MTKGACERVVRWLTLDSCSGLREDVTERGTLRQDWSQQTGSEILCKDLGSGHSQLIYLLCKLGGRQSVKWSLLCMNEKQHKA